MLGYYAFDAEAYDPDKQGYVVFDGVFRMEVDRPGRSTCRGDDDDSC